MSELILPGYSTKNAPWAQDLKADLSSVGKFELIEWPHWRDPDLKFDAKEEGQKLVDRLANDDVVVIVAKSIGTLVTMYALPEVKDKVKKLVLCGVLLVDLLEQGGTEAYQALADFPLEKLLVIQNSEDNHGSYDDVVEFLKKINPGIEVVKKEKADHDYPYPQDIQEFLIK